MAEVVSDIKIVLSTYVWDRQWTEAGDVCKVHRVRSTGEFCNGGVAFGRVPQSYEYTLEVYVVEYQWSSDTGRTAAEAIIGVISQINHKHDPGNILVNPYLNDP